MLENGGHAALLYKDEDKRSIPDRYINLILFFRANYIAINQGSINLIEQNKMIERSWREDYINSRVTRYYYW